MIRRVIDIDEERCTGCRLCVDACHEGAIGMVDGKARLLRDDYCDGLGDCLPACPAGAIAFVEREADAYDEAAVAAHLAARRASDATAAAGGAPAGCPGSRARDLGGRGPAASGAGVPAAGDLPSRLAQWPAQIRLMPVQAPYYEGRGLLVAADCTAFACASFHERLMRGKVTVIGCPKLDEGSYADKLAAIIAANAITGVTVARMEVPCCGGLERAAAEALERSGKELPFEVVTLSVNGEVLA